MCTLSYFRNVTIILLNYYTNIQKEIMKGYHIYPKYWDRQSLRNSVDPDQMLHSAASDLGLHCLPLIQQYFDIPEEVNWTCYILG